VNHILNTRLRCRIFDAQTLTCKNLEHAKIRSKYYDRKANPQAFNKHDYVYLLKEPLKGKFDEQCKRPYKILEILEILGNNNVKLAISGQKLYIVIN